jgi:hypothetical protein
MIRASDQQPIILQEVTDPAELAAAAVRRQRFERNWTWFGDHAKEIYGRNRGKCVCVSGEQLFVGNTPEQALAAAKQAHPDDDGRFTRIIPREKGERIYAHRGTLDRPGDRLCMLAHKHANVIQQS